MQEAIIQKLSKDEVLRRIIAEVDFPKINSTGNVFHDLMSCVIEQQIHYRSTKRIFEKRLIEANLSELTLENFEVFEKDALSNIKLSSRKYETILSVLEFFQNNNIDWDEKTDSEIYSLLSKIKGVGRWTIDMILLYTLDRPDIFTSDDYHIKMMMAKLYPIDTSVEMKAQFNLIANKWSPYRSFGFLYLMSWKNQAKNRAK